MSGDKVPDKPSGVPVTFKQTTTKFAASKNATTIMLNSTDRDTNVYPQPTRFSIRLPRIFRNVVGISVTQIKLLSAFYYFSAAKNNTSVRILEYGRQIKNSSGQLVDNNIDVVVDPIFEVTTSDKILFFGGKSVAKLTGFGARYENPRNKLEAVKELKAIDTTDVEKFERLYGKNDGSKSKNNPGATQKKKWWLWAAIAGAALVLFK
jgi:hypothetical protein